MSYDLMVFDASAAPRGRKAFMEWFKQQTQWTETHGYNVSSNEGDTWRPTPSGGFETSNE